MRRKGVARLRPKMETLQREGLKTGMEVGFFYDKRDAMSRARGGEMAGIDGGVRHLSKARTQKRDGEREK